jgi:1,4-alpha-glucan branching enzyme
MARSIPETQIEAIIHGNHRDPFSRLGMHKVKGGLVVRAFLPGAQKVQLVDAKTAKVIADLQSLHEDGLFAARLAGRKEPFAYRLRVFRGNLHGNQSEEIYDPYAFAPVLGEVDRYLLSEGTHYRSYDKLGAHVVTIDGVDGVSFALWAPNARRVSVVGDFNNWDGRRHVMRLHPGCGIWEIFIPGIGEGELYKFEIKGADGALLPLKADPYAFYMEQSPGTASIVHDIGGFSWTDQDWLDKRAAKNRRDAPISIYEVHLGSWRRKPEDGNRALSYRELADSLIPYVKSMGFTHVELLPVTEFPFDGSWGYQPIGLFAPTSRYGAPDDFRCFVDRCHAEGIGVILDWVVGHFPEDPHGLGDFDGTHLFEHADPRMGRHADWGTLIYNFTRAEVANYLLANALFWLEQYHIDGLRVDAVASMLYLDYSREEGEWVPNEQGGNENLGAVAFLRRLNELVYARHPGAFTVAEESTSWPKVSRPTDMGGLGFGYKWNMGWMNDSLDYISHEPVHRKYHHNELTFSLIYAFSENFVLPVSHDEVVHGKGSLLARMPGDEWQKFANMRLYLAYMFTHPGKKLLFMGCEFAQGGEWDYRTSLDWHLADLPQHQGIQTLVRDLNRLYRETPALHDKDCEAEGFSWIEANDSEQSVLSYIRYGKSREDAVIVLCNFTPVVREHYQIGVPLEGTYEEVLNTDSRFYGGSDKGNLGTVQTRYAPAHGQPVSLRLTLPPLGAVVLRRSP